MPVNWGLYDDTRDQGRVTIHRAHIKKVYEHGGTQVIDGSGFAGTSNRRIEHIQPVGFTSNPGGGEKVEAYFLDGIGDATHRVCIGIMGDRKKNLRVPEGHAALFSPADNRMNVRATPDGIRISAPGQKVIIEDAEEVVVHAPNIVLDGDVHVTGNMQVDGNENVGGSLTHGGGPCCCC